MLYQWSVSPILRASPSRKSKGHDRYPAHSEMGRRERQSLAERILHFYFNQCNKSKLRTVHHFVSEGISRNTVYSTIRRYELSGDTTYKKVPGRPTAVATKNSPNVPQARGIEKFWASCKVGFTRVWKRISAEVAQKCAKQIMHSAWKMIQKIGHKGIEGAAGWFL